MQLREETEQSWRMEECPSSMIQKEAAWDGDDWQRCPLNGLCLQKPLPLDSQRLLIMLGNTVVLGNDI